MSASNNLPLLSLKNISKSFPGVKALQNVHLDIYPGEIHALMGENGAGKSTLLKIMFGAYTADEGSVELSGVPVSIRGPIDALSKGISMVHQEISLVPQLSAVQNIVLGRERSIAGFIDWRAARREALAALQRLDFQGNPHVPVSRLSIGQQQAVELARAIAANSKIIIMDEPTASLSTNESEKLFSVLRELRADGHALVYVSHRLAEVFDLGDRATVLRDGEYVGTLKRGPELTEPALIKMMVGRSLEDFQIEHKPHLGDVALKVEGLARRDVFEDITFDVRKGEIVGMAGMIGSGRTEVARCVTGADAIDAGTVTINGRRLAMKSPRDAVKAGIAFLTEDRKHQGLALRMSLAKNATLTRVPTSFGFIKRRQQTSNAESALASVGARMPTSRLAGQLSGGNQQKVVLAKWLLSDCNIFIFDEPTRGIDVGAKAEIYALMRDLADKGAAILMISSDLPEVLRMSDRVLVMREGTLAGEVSRAEATEEKIIAYASGGKAWPN
jgi:ABC-type sugar transport system ATPase subunit